MNFESNILVFRLTQQLMKGMLGHLINPITWTLVIENLTYSTETTLNLVLLTVFKFCKIKVVRKVRIIFSCDADMYGFSKG